MTVTVYKIFFKSVPAVDGGGLAYEECGTPSLEFDCQPLEEVTRSPVIISARVHGRTGHIFIGVAAGFPSRSTPSGGYPQVGLSGALGVAALRAATDSKLTINSYF